MGFVESKGGVGTSTTAVNIAAVLVQNGSDALVIELQPGPEPYCFTWTVSRHMASLDYWRNLRIRSLHRTWSTTWWKLSGAPPAVSLQFSRHSAFHRP